MDQSVSVRLSLEQLIEEKGVGQTYNNTAIRNQDAHTVLEVLLPNAD
jgi:hypothetical protein